MLSLVEADTRILEKACRWDTLDTEDVLVLDTLACSFSVAADTSLPDTSVVEVVVDTSVQEEDN